MKKQNTFGNRQVLETRYRNSRSNLLLVVAFTLINIVLLITKSNRFFLFSAYAPYVIVDFGMLICGMYPPEYYGEDSIIATTLPASVFTVFVVIASIILTLYFVSWLLSKNKPGWLIFALVFFIVDTLFMFALYNFQAGSLVDIFFHLWVIFSLVIGIIANAKLKKLPPDEDGTPAVSEADESYATGEEIQNSNALRVADPNVKARILLETNESGHNITYRRVKKTNELVIDGYVYDEYTATLELPHSLEARIDGIHIKAGLDSTNSSYITIDGNIIEKKLRLY